MPDADAVPVTVHGRGLEGRRGDRTPPAAGSRDALGRDDLRLVHVHPPRPLNPQHARPGEATAFADAYPVTLASAASLRRLHEWVAETALERGEEPRAPLAIERFRPNLVVDGDLEPFEEDRWRRVQVGAVDFRVVKPVDRCVMTTVDPDDARARPRADPHPREAPQVGRCHVVRGAARARVRGVVRVGDEVVARPVA